ncbi:MAG: tyrosine--tRNA ligase [Thermodesulfobacteriota bacterium]
MPDIDSQMARIMRGVEEVIHEDELRKRLEHSLKTGKPLRIKLGVDPTASDIHLGHMVTIRKLKHFQDCGHTAIFLIGDFTARVGDPTERSEGRTRLTKDEVWTHADTYKAQVFQILDEEKTELRSNGEWFDNMSFADCLDLAYRSTVARMLERNDFENRYKSGNPISITEFLYPLMQGYDSVALECDVELGGTDQKFNLLAGRDMQIQHNQPPQIVMMTPLIEGLDGAKKMSKTLGNYIAINDTAEEMFGKTMSIRDDLMVKYFTLLTDVDSGLIKQYEAALETPDLHREAADPLHVMNIKKALALAIVTEYIDSQSAERARAHFEKVVQRKEIPDEQYSTQYQVPLSMTTSNEKGMHSIGIIELVASASGMSKSDARRIVTQGGVEYDGVKVSDVSTEVAVDGEKRVLKAGKRKFFLVSTADGEQ